MRNFLTLCGAGLVVILGIVSGNLWKELRTARLQIVALQDQLAQAKIPVVQLAPVPAPTPTPEAPPMPTAQPANPPPLAALRRAPASERPVGVPTLTAPLVGRDDEERRVEALAQSDRTATARVTAWNTALNFTPEQMQALNEITTAELRRETEDSLRLNGSNGPMDAVSTARLKVETVNRQYETLTRIAEKVAPHLTPEQHKSMTAMFDRWLTNNMARARAEEAAALSGR